MRILVILPTFHPDYMGGAEIAAFHSCRELQRRGMELHMLVVSNRHAARSQQDSFDFEGLPVRRMRFNTMIRTQWSDVFDARIFHVVRSEVARVRPDLVHIHNVSGATLAPFLACRATGVKTVSTLHDLWLLCPNNMAYRRDGTLCALRQTHTGCGMCFRRYDYWGDIPFRRALFGVFTANVRFFISPSQALIDRHVYAGYDSRRFRKVRNGFATLHGSSAIRGPVADQFDRTSQNPRIIYSGGGVETKGAATLLSALPILLRHIENLEVFVAGGGDGKVLDAMRAFEPSVRVLGPLPHDDLRILFSTSDLMAVPSVWYENSPTVIYESLQVGTPVVGSNIGGIPELVEDEETGYLFPRGDAAMFAEKVINHFSRPARMRRHMRMHCVDVSRTRLSMDQHIAGIMRVYDDALAC